MEQMVPMLTKWGVRVLGVFVIMWVAFKLARTVQQRLTGTLNQRKFDSTLAVFFGSLARWAVMLVAVLSCFSIFDIETTSFAAIIGAAGLAIGLAFQGTLGNFSAGVMLLVFRPFKVGDVVNIAGNTGTVAELGLFTTAIDTADGRRFIVPNGQVANGIIQNITHHPDRRADVAVGVEYSADIDATRAVLEAAVLTVEGRHPTKPHQIMLDTLGDSAVVWQVRVWCATEDYWAVRERTTRAVKMGLDAAGIGIPFPQVELHLNAQATAQAVPALQKR